MSKAALSTALFLVCFAGAARAESDGLPVGMLVVAETSLAIDMLQTASAVHAGLLESNPILGPHPSDGKLLAYFGGCMLGTAAATLLVPEEWRGFAPAIVLLLEVPQIAHNATVRWGFRVPF